MPPHEVYIETHLGGGSVLRHKKPALRSIGIDCDEKVINAWKRQPEIECELIHGRAEDYLASCQFNGQELVYADPPYVPSTRRREKVYSCDYSISDHESLLNRLKVLPCKVMISGYENALYEQLLSTWNTITFDAMTHTGIRKETVWFNFESPVQLHDSRYIGMNFRHRQTVKRRIQRWKCKLSEMDPVERHALIHWLDETYVHGGSI
jgi:site-specific DNA-adenine methylase